MWGHPGEVGEDGVEERGGVMGDVGRHTLQQKQNSLHCLGQGEDSMRRGMAHADPYMIAMMGI